jgi:calcineurin-like phosphoesterase family protein
MIYFTSDTHFGHKNIIKYCDRPYDNIENMNDDIITKYNSIVKPDDTVYHLGDFAFHTHPTNVGNILTKLNGSKHLIFGNHDRDFKGNYLKMGFLSANHYLEICDIFLIHNPARIPKNNIKQVLCGHVHQNWKIKDSIINVGVDVWNFFPVSITQIESEIQKIKI